MTNEFLGITATLISMTAMGLMNGFSKRPSEVLGPVRATIYRELITVPALLLLVLATLSSTSFDLVHIALGVGISTASYFGLYYFMKAVAIGKASLIGPIVNSRVLVTTVLAIFVYGERLSPPQFGAIALILLGVILLSIDSKTFSIRDLIKPQSGIGFALAAAVIWGVTFGLFAIPIAVIGAYLFSFLLELSVLVTSSTQLALQKEPFTVSADLIRKVRVPLIGMGVAGIALTLFMNIGYELIDVSVVAAINSANPLVTIIYGRFFLGEQLNAKQYAAIAILLAGIILISYF